MEQAAATCQDAPCLLAYSLAHSHAQEYGNGNAQVQAQAEWPRHLRLRVFAVWWVTVPSTAAGAARRPGSAYESQGTEYVYPVRERGAQMRPRLPYFIHFASQ